MSDEFGFVGLRVKLGAAKTTMPFPAPWPDPPFLIRDSHLFLDFCVEGTSGRPHFTGACALNRRPVHALSETLRFRSPGSGERRHSSGLPVSTAIAGTSDPNPVFADL